MEKDVTTNLVCGIVADFMNQVNDGERFAFENAVHAFKENVELTDEQEAMVRNSLMHLEIIAQNCEEGFDLKGFVGLECNVILWTLAGDWEILIKRTMGDSEDFTPDNVAS